MNAPFLRPLATLFAALLALPALAAACSDPSTGSSSGTVKPVCIVGQNSACLCADGQTGTKECLASEGQYTECRLGPSTPCPTGAPDSGTPIGPEELCPGKAVGVGATAATIKGTLAAATADLKGESACAALEGNPDHVYKLVSTATGALKIDQKGAYKAALYVRKGDCTGGKQVRCDPNGPASFSVNVVAGREYFLVVKGVTASGAGDYELSLQVTPGGFCGDGQVKDQEVCDDENNDPMDGCAAGCNEIEGIADSANSCPGQQVVIPVGRVVKVSNGNTTQGAKSTFNRSGVSGCSNGSTNAANDRVYTVTPRKTGNLRVKQTAGDFNLAIIAQGACDPNATANLGCASDCGLSSGAPPAPIVPPACAEQVLVPVTADKTYTIVVEGQGTSGSGSEPLNAGTYALEMSVE